MFVLVILKSVLAVSFKRAGCLNDDEMLNVAILSLYYKRFQVACRHKQGYLKLAGAIYDSRE